MKLDVLGCHGGESSRHRTSSFLVDDTVAIDAGALCTMLSLEDQRRLRAVIVSHAHLDHVRDLAPLSDTRCQQGGPPLTIAGTPATLAALKAHFFNNILWPDFSKIVTPMGPTVVFVPLIPDEWTDIEHLRVRPIPVNHTVDSSAFMIDSPEGMIVYSGDTGPTDLLWQRMAAVQGQIKNLIMEVSFPNALAQLALSSGHHTPDTLERDLSKLGSKPEFEVSLFHIKPVFQDEVERELTRLKRREFTVLKLGDRSVF